MKSLSQLKKKTWELVSRYMRLKYPVCEICKKNESVHCHHIIKRSKSNALFFDERNLLSLCKNCHDRIHIYKKWHEGFDDIQRYMILKSLRTEEELNYLEMKKHGTYKFSHYKLEELIKDYKQRVKEIEKN